MPALPRPRPSALTALLIATLLVGSGACHAMGGLLLMDPVPKDTAKLAVGASGWWLPRDPGAGRQRLWLLPGIDYYAPSGLFVSTDIGVGWNASPRDDIQAGVRLAPHFGRSHKDALAAGDASTAIGTRLERGAFFNFAPNDALLLQSGLRMGSGRHGGGLLLEFGATSGLPLPNGELIGLTAGASWANGDYRSSYFGVPSNAAGGRRAGTTLSDGWQDLQFAISHEHRFSPLWRLDTQLLAARLVAATARSPLTRSREQRILSISLWRDLP